MSKSLKKVKSSYCIMPFHAFSNDALGNRRLCCNSQQTVYRENGEPYHILDDDLSESLNSPILKEIRRAILNGEKHPACQMCWNDEERGAHSLRQIFTNKLSYIDKNIKQSVNQVYKDGSMDVSKNEYPYLDITLGNICNLKCKMCNESSSHKIHEELLQRNIPSTGDRYTWVRDSSIVNKLTDYLESCYEIHFLGGEPLIIKEHDKILEKIIEFNRQDKVELSYISNMNDVPQRILKYWSQFKKIHCGVSIDGFEELDEYIRFGTNWNKKVNNIYKLTDYDNVRTDFHITVQAFNFRNIPRIISWLIEISDDLANKDDEFDKWRIRAPFLNYVTHHDYLDPKVLPYDLKQQAVNELIPVLEELRKPNIPMLKQYANRVEKSYYEILNEDKSHLWSQFKEYVKNQDKFRYRNENKILDVCPEFEPYW